VIIKLAAPLIFIDFKNERDKNPYQCKIEINRQYVQRGQYGI